jgi:hypothetical protein
MLLAKRNDSEDHSPIPWLVLKRRCVAVFEAPIDSQDLAGVPDACRAHPAGVVLLSGSHQV